MNLTFEISSFLQISLSLNLKTCCDFLNLKQLNQVKNDYDSILDLVLPDISDLNIIRSHDELLDIDPYHNPIEFNFSMYNEIPQTKPVKFFKNFKKGNYTCINNFFNQIDWVSSLSNENLDININTFYETLHHSINCFIPVDQRKFDNYPVWFSNELKSLIAKKKFFHSKYKYFRSQSLYRKFSQLRSACKKLAQECYTLHMEKIQLDLALNPKSFWRNYNSKNKKNPIPSNLRYLNEQSSCDFSSATLFNKYFSSVFELDDNHSLLVASVQEKTDLSNIPYLSLSIVFDFITKLTNDCSFGPDGIPNFFLKKCVYSLTYPLWILFKQSIEKVIFPDY